MSITRFECNDNEFDAFHLQLCKNITHYVERYYPNVVFFKRSLASAGVSYQFFANVHDYIVRRKSKITIHNIIQTGKLLGLPTGVILFADLEDLIIKKVIAKDVKGFHFIIQPNYITDGFFFYSKARHDFLPIGNRFFSHIGDIKDFQSYTLKDEFFEIKY